MSAKFCFIKIVGKVGPDSTHHLDHQKKGRKIGGEGEAIFDTPFMVQSHRGLWDLSAN